MSYLKIQFIGYAISTLPKNIFKIEQEYETGEYLGLPNSIEDIDARMVLLKKAIETAQDRVEEMGDHQHSTLKVFVVPEFYFRGANGAYTDGLRVDKVFAMDSKEKWDDHLGYIESELIKIIDNEKYGDWLFIVGTVLVCKEDPGKSCPKPEIEKEVQLKSNVIDSYLKVWRENNIGADDEGWFELLKNIMNLCNSTSQNIVNNTCLCLQGGKFRQGAKRLAVRVNKQYKSMEDFILNRSTSSLRGYQEHTVSYGDIQDQTDTFDIDEIKFGVEICLDHRRERLREEGHNDLDVQVITSCGMQIIKDSVCVKSGGLIFNCDGEYDKVEETIVIEKSVKSSSFVRTIQPATTETTKMIEAVIKTQLKSNTAMPELIPGSLSHTQLAGFHKTRSSEGDLRDLGKDRINRFKVKAVYLKITDEVTKKEKNVNLDEIFAHGSGEIHLYKAVEIRSNV
jgi:hypothetical protein